MAAKGISESLARLLEAHEMSIPTGDLWALATTHKSYAYEAGEELGGHNERLEFLGDAVVSLAVSERLYASFPERPEGDLARMRAAVVRAESLADSARRLGLGALLRLGKGEERSGGRQRTSLLADAFEALVGALFLEHGWERVKPFVLEALAPELSRYARPGSAMDAKSLLQEALQAGSKTAPVYRLKEAKGPDHAKSFVSQVIHQGKVLGEGSGRSKKAAEQAAAEDALRRLKACRDPRPGE